MELIFRMSSSPLKLEGWSPVTVVEVYVPSPQYGSSDQIGT